MPEIQSLTLRAQDLTRSVDRWNTAMIWTLVFAAIAAILVVVATSVAFKRAKQLAGVQVELLHLKDAGLETDLKDKDVKIAEASKKAAEANERAASLEVEAAQLREQLSTQERRGTLLMNPRIRKQFDSRINGFAGQYFDVVSCGLEESEISYFSMSIWGTLQGAGWTIGKIENNSPSCSEGLIVLINPSAPRKTKEAAQALLDAFIEAGLAPHNSIVGNIPEPPADARKPGTWFLGSSRIDSVLVLVGTHP